MEGYVYGANPILGSMSDEEAIATLQNRCNQHFSEQQLEILRTRGSMEVISCAGSGKTHTLINLVGKRVLTGEIADPSKVLLTTFSKAGKSNMQDRLTELFATLGVSKCPVTVSTMHSVYYWFLTRCTNVYRLNTISESERMGYIRQASKLWKPRVTEDEAQEISSLISYQVNNLISINQLYNSYVFDMDMDLRTFTNVYNEFFTLKHNAGVLDFDDMQYHTFWYLYQSDPQYRANYVRLIQRYSDIFVDEFQDTSRIQYAILIKMIVNKDNCLFIGDDDQCIYEWRGSDPSILLNLVGDFPGISKKRLSTNYRCKSVILDYAKTGVKAIKLREEKDMVAENPGGKVEFLFGNSKKLHELSILTVDKIEEMVKSGVKRSDIALLTRNNATLHIVQAELIDRMLWTDFDGGMRISKSNYFKDVCSLTALCNPNGVGLNDKQLAKSLMWKVVAYLGAKNSQVFINLMDATGCTLTTAIDYVLYKCGYLEEFNEELIKLNARQEAQTFGVIRALSSDTLLSLRNFRKGLNEPDITKRLEHVLRCYRLGVDFMARKESTARLFNGYSSYFISKLQQKGYNGFRDFLQIIAGYEESDTSAYGPLIRISTMHGGKGLEWKNVFLFAFDNYTFPDAEYVKEKTAQGQNLTTFFDGERRLAYVASTRAIDNLYIVTDTRNASYLCLEQLGMVKGENIFDINEYLSEVISNEMENKPEYFLDKERTVIELPKKEG